MLNEREEKIGRGRMTTESSVSKTDSEAGRRKSLKDVVGERPQVLMVREGKETIRQ